MRLHPTRCDARKLLAQCGQLGIDLDGRVQGAYWERATVAMGRYFISYPSSSEATIKDIDTFSDLMSFRGWAAAKLDGGRKPLFLVETPLTGTRTSDPSGFATRVDAYVVDAST